MGRRIASGGGGTVYEARHEVLGSSVAVKLLSEAMMASSTAIERFMREAWAASRLCHPNIVRVFDFGRSNNGIPYYVMEYFEDAEPLDQLVRRLGRLSLSDFFSMADGLLDAVAACHRASILHRDIKPSNVLVRRLGGTLTGLLIDFGIAKLVDDDDPMTGLTTVGRKLGTPVAMAPEQIRGAAVDAQADVYSLGVLMYFAIAGNYPFQGATITELEYMHLAASPAPLRNLGPMPTALEEVVMACLEKNPRDRPDGAEAVRERLRAVASHGAGTTAGLTTRSDLAPSGRTVLVQAHLRTRAAGATAAGVSRLVTDVSLLESEMETRGVSPVYIEEDRVVLAVVVPSGDSTLRVVERLRAELTPCLSGQGAGSAAAPLWSALELGELSVDRISSGEYEVPDPDSWAGLDSSGAVRIVELQELTLPQG
jgi:serine/threonine protein kinase